MALLLVAGSATAATYTIRVEDLVAGGPATGQPMTPPVAAVHDASYSLFAVGAAASPGLETLAEEGNPMPLVAEATGAAGVSDVVVGSMGPFFDMVEFEVEGEAGDLLSVVSMFARSNDLITGVHAVELQASGKMIYMTQSYDAGTEVNSGLVADIPFYGNANVGVDENGVVTMINAYSVLDDPDVGQIDYTFPPAARITVTRQDSTPVEDTTWGSIKSLYQ
jgi:hypothetical protein